MSPKSSPYLCRFMKNHNSQYSVLKIIEIWKQNIDKGNPVGILLKDLSKAFGTINHSLLLVKLEVYGFSANSQTFIELLM